MESEKSVLFVCLGNICRSPIAEAIFINLLKQRKLESVWRVESAAIESWHVGKPPDARAIKVMSDHGIDPPSRAQQIKTSDFTEFDYIFGMDESNIFRLNGVSLMNATATAKIELLGDYHPKEKGLIIEDPYYDTGDEGFKICYEQCVECLKNFLETVHQE